MLATAWANPSPRESLSRGRLAREAAPGRRRPRRSRTRRRCSRDAPVTLEADLEREAFITAHVVNRETRLTGAIVRDSHEHGPRRRKRAERHPARLHEVVRRAHRPALSMRPTRTMYRPRGTAMFAEKEEASAPVSTTGVSPPRPSSPRSRSRAASRSPHPAGRVTPRPKRAGAGGSVIRIDGKKARHPKPRSVDATGPSTAAVRRAVQSRSA